MTILKINHGLRFFEQEIVCNRHFFGQKSCTPIWLIVCFAPPANASASSSRSPLGVNGIIELLFTSPTTVTFSAYRIQRERWGRGLIHSGFKHIGQMLLQRMPLMKRMHAISTMFSSVLLASIYVLIMLSLPLTYLVHFDGAGMRWGALGFFGLVVLWGLENAFGARRGARFDGPPNVLKDLWDTYRYISMFLPMAWYYFAGGVRALFGVYGDFHRTPKGKEGYRAFVPRINSVLLAGEIFTFFYSQ